MVTVHLNSTQEAPDELVCVDIDRKDVWVRLTNPNVLSILGAPLIYYYARGGHLIFKSGSGNLAQKRMIGAVLLSGAQVDWLTTETILIGPHKSALGVAPDTIDEISEIPVALTPSKLKSPIQKLFREDKGFEVEGNRRNALNAWSFRVKGTEEEILSQTRLANLVFCEPPLDDEEIAGIAKGIPATDSSDDAALVAWKNVQSRDVIRIDRDAVVDALRGKFLYEEGITAWYVWNGSHWQVRPERTVAQSIEEIILEIAEDLKTPLTPMNSLAMARNHLPHLGLKLAITDREKKIVTGMSFENGFLDFSTGKLRAHDSSVFVRSTIRTDYDPEQGLSVDSQRFFESCLGFDRKNLTLLRSMLYRCLNPQPGLHTAYFLHGSAGAGKSTVIKIIADIIGRQMTTMGLSELDNKFSRREIHFKSVLCINEVYSLKPSEETWIKQITGRDHIPGNVKFQQENFTEQFEGVVLLTSNGSPESVYAASRPLTDRLIPLRFHTVLGKKDPGLNAKLSENQSGIINWALSFPQENLSYLTRAGDINASLITSSTPMVAFIEERVYYHKDAILPKDQLVDQYNVFAYRYDGSERQKKGDVYQLFEATLLEKFNVHVEPTLKPGDGGIVGEIRLARAMKLNIKDKSGKQSRPHGWVRIGLYPPGTEIDPNYPTLSVVQGNEEMPYNPYLNFNEEVNEERSRQFRTGQFGGAQDLT